MPRLRFIAAERAVIIYKTIKLEKPSSPERIARHFMHAQPFKFTPAIGEDEALDRSTFEELVKFIRLRPILPETVDE